MELAAVVMMPGDEALTETCESQPYDFTPFEVSRPRCSSLFPILGNDVVQTWAQRVRKLGVQSFWVTPRPREDGAVYSALRGFVREGIERFLVIQLKAYAEMDLAELLSFHCQTRSAITETHDSRGQLGVSVFNRSADRRESRIGTAPTQGALNSYPFHGYAKRILPAKERQELVRDALTGACAMRPLGKEISKDVWVGANVRLADSVRLIGPSYIGDRAIIQAGATIGPFASVEHDCVVGYGTRVERSTILPSTYLAPGLLIRQALVEGESLEDLVSGAVADLKPACLAHRIRPAEHDEEASEAVRDVFGSAGSGAWARGSSTDGWRQVHI